MLHFKRRVCVRGHDYATYHTAVRVCLPPNGKGYSCFGGGAHPRYQSVLFSMPGVRLKMTKSAEDWSGYR